MTANFSTFRKSCSDTKNLINAILYCSKEGISTLTFDKGVYVFDDDLAP